MEYIIRKAVPSDIPMIEALFIEMLQTVTGRSDVEGYEAGYLDRFFGDQGDVIFIAEVEGKVIAFLSVEVHRDPFDYLYLDDLSVTAACRNRGIGTALLRNAEDYAAHIGFRDILLHVEKSNIDAKRLYDRMGFYIFRDEDHRYLMRREVRQRA